MELKWKAEEKHDREKNELIDLKGRNGLKNSLFPTYFAMLGWPSRENCRIMASKRVRITVMQLLTTNKPTVGNGQPDLKTIRLSDSLL